MDVESPFHVLQKPSSVVRATQLARVHLLFSAALTFLPMRVLVSLSTTALLLVASFLVLNEEHNFKEAWCSFDHIALERNGETLLW